MRKRRKKITKTTLAIIAFFIFIAIVMAIAILSDQKTQTKPPARDYFKIEEVTALAEPFDDQNQTIKVKMLSFKITPIKGSAHHVSINPGGDVPMVDWPYFLEIKCNETMDLAKLGKEICYPTPVLAHKTENGYSMTIRVSCDETSWDVNDQKVKIYITEWIPFE